MNRKTQAETSMRKAKRSVAKTADKNEAKANVLAIRNERALEKLREQKFQKKLQSLRAKIDVADHAMIRALAKRTEVVERIGIAKKNHGEALSQKGRWSQLLRDRTELASKLGVDRKLILEIFDCIQKESIARQARANSKGRKK